MPKTDNHDDARRERNEWRAARDKRYKRLCAAAADCYEQAMRAGYEPDRRRLMARSDDLRVRALLEQV